MRFLKTILATTFAVTALAIGAVAVSAAESSQNTTLTFTIPTFITMTGLATSYSGTGPAGSQSTIATGPLTITTNNPTGYTLKLGAASAVFQGAGSVNNHFPVGDDMLSASPCPAGAVCSSAPLSDVSQTTVVHTTAASSDTFAVNHGITPPATQTADSYSVSVNYDALTN
jgi:hypothetical protein